MRNGTKYILGAFLVVIGVLVIFGSIELNLSWIFRLSWPTIIIGISFLLFLGYYSKRPYGTGYLVPAGTLFAIGVTFLIGEVFSYNLIWPSFIAAPAVGLLLLYIFGKRSPGLLVPIGILLTLASTFFLGEIFGIWYLVWPGFIASPAVGLLLYYLRGSRNPGLLVPIGILLTIAGLSSFASLFNAWRIVWPGFIMAPAVGLFLLYIAGNRDSSLLLPIFVLTAISVTFFSLFALRHLLWFFRYIVGGILVLAGLTTILNRSSRHYDSSAGPDNFDGDGWSDSSEGFDRSNDYDSNNFNNDK
ncbi:MAG: hypothetical protein GX184_04380 [Clostridiaceae bacterium]|nr:hypothetical protein [Clostridiaceae bacterium]